MTRIDPLPELMRAFFYERLVEQRNVSAHTVRSYRDTWRQPEGFQYSAFCEHYRRWRQQLTTSMRQTHTPGVIMLTLRMTVPN